MSVYNINYSLDGEPWLITTLLYSIKFEFDMFDSNPIVDISKSDSKIGDMDSF